MKKQPAALLGPLDAYGSSTGKEPPLDRTWKLLY